ncbi:MAG: fasciclin domain-containing protein [Gemmatimonadota bacterium]
MHYRSIALGAVALALVSISDIAGAQVTTTTGQTTTTTTTVANQDIIETLQAAGNFSTFLQVVDRAGLTAQLKGAGPFTVFAPTDEAFSRLNPMVRDSIMSSQGSLEALVKNHVVSGRLTADDVRKQSSGVGFMGGTSLTVDTTGAGVRINGASVVKGNINATNGIIHAIDTVFTPIVSQQVNGTNPADSTEREKNQSAPTPKP